MGKLRSGRVKRIPQIGITSDRYQFLGLDQSEPNLGDPRVGVSSVGINPIKAGAFYQLAAIAEYPGERFWSTQVGIGTSLGVISVYANNVLPNSAFERIHGLNFVGTGVTIETPPLELFDGIGIATIRFTVTDIQNRGEVGQVLYNTSSGYAYGASELYYIDGNVGIGSTIPQYKLDILGDARLDGKLSVGGTTGELGQYLSATGTGVTWTTFPVLRTGFTTIATVGQTGFTTSYNVGFLDIYVNGVRLTGSEYIATDGNIIILNAPCFGGETVDIFAYGLVSNGSGSGGIGGSGGGGDSYWVKNSSGIHTLSSVGIGTTNPQTILQINGVLGFGTFDNGGTRTNIRIGDNTTGANIDGGFNNISMGIGAGNGTFGLINTIGITSSTAISSKASYYWSGVVGTGGSGVGALFDIQRDATFGDVLPPDGYVSVSAQGVGYKVGDIITLNGADVGGSYIIGITSSTAIISQGGASYSNVPGTGGFGIGMSFNIFRDGLFGDVLPPNGALVINNQGTGYQIGDVITIDGANVGGVSITDDITVTITSIPSTDTITIIVTSIGGAYGSNNNFLGSNAGYYNLSGNNNNFFGYNAGYYNTTGYDNNFLGNLAGYYNLDGYYNNFLGNQAGYYNLSGHCNNFLGQSAGLNNTTGSFNNFFGNNVGVANTTGSCNNFFGVSSGRNNTTGFNNNFIGYLSGSENTTGDNNTFIGNFAGEYNTTGTHNIFIGQYASPNSGKGEASYKILLGHGPAYGEGEICFDSPKENTNNQFAVGLNTTGTSEYWLVGDENFNIGIGTTNPTSKLTVGGTILATDGFISIGNTTPIQISLVGNQLTFTAVGIGSTTLTLS